MKIRPGALWRLSAFILIQLSPLCVFYIVVDGALTGLSKKMIKQIYGDKQFKMWRRGFHEPPPPISSFSSACKKCLFFIFYFCYLDFNVECLNVACFDFVFVFNYTLFVS